MCAKAHSNKSYYSDTFKHKDKGKSKAREKRLNKKTEMELKFKSKHVSFTQTQSKAAVTPKTDTGEKAKEAASVKAQSANAINGTSAFHFAPFSRPHRG